MPQLWEVMGGADKGGILVRKGQDLKSDAEAVRLSTGAIVEELELKGERMKYKLCKGTGPAEGWVSTKITGKELLAKRDASVLGSEASAQSGIALLFPGQGSQYIGMLNGLKDDPEVKALIETANKVVGKDLLEICLKGPTETLDETSVCQPAMFLGGMAGMVKLRKDRAEAAGKFSSVAGLSLGEYTALCVAGVFTFEQGMELVKVRGAAMGEAASKGEQAMLSVAGLQEDVLRGLCENEAKGGEVCQIANCLFPNGFSCAGTKKAIDKLQKAAEGAGALQAKLLKTSGAFHTSLMEPAKQKLEEALEKLMPEMKPPTCDIYMNVTGAKIKAGTPPSEFVPLLGKQLVSSVLWEQSMNVMIKDGVTEFYEVGPMKQLKAMMKRIDPKVWKTTINMEV